jgi:mono/diheme cytochrome c family protein
MLLATLSLVAGCDGDGSAVDLRRFASSEARMRGHALFVEHCAICHGVVGDGRGQRRAGFQSRPTDFTSPTWRARMSPGRVFESIRDGKRGTSMPAWSALSHGRITDLTAYVWSLGEDDR